LIRNIALTLRKNEKLNDSHLWLKTPIYDLFSPMRRIDSDVTVSIIQTVTFGYKRGLKARACLLLSLRALSLSVIGTGGERITGEERFFEGVP